MGKYIDKYIDKPKKNNINKVKQQAKDKVKKEVEKVKQNKQLIQNIVKKGKWNKQNRKMNHI